MLYDSHGCRPCKICPNDGEICDWLDTSLWVDFANNISIDSKSQGRLWHVQGLDKRESLDFSNDGDVVTSMDFAPGFRLEMRINLYIYIFNYVFNVVYYLFILFLN